MTEKALIFLWGVFVGVEFFTYVIVCPTEKGDRPPKTNSQRLGASHAQQWAVYIQTEDGLWKLKTRRFKFILFWIQFTLWNLLKKFKNQNSIFPHFG